MATTTPLTDAINALTTYANSVTGGSDTDLSSAVATLASGYGGGGTTPTAFVSETTVTADSDVTGTNNSLTVMTSLASGLQDTSNYDMFLFFFLNNSASTKAAVFGWCQRYSSSNYYHGGVRVASGTYTWRCNNAMDFWYTAGTEIHILEFNSLIGTE